MADANPSRLGQIEAAGDDDALFLKEFTGEVLTAYTTAVKTDGRHVQRSLNSGKSAQFSAMWKNSARYHTPGTEITGQNIKHDELVVEIDDLLISDAFVAEIDELKNHYDVRAEYSSQCGIALAAAKDRNVLRCMLLATESGTSSTWNTAIFSGASPAGTKTTNAAMKTDATVLAAGFFSAAQTLMENDIPEAHKRSGFIRPAQYFILVANKDLLNKDWGGVGSFAAADLPQVAGIELVVTNHLPITDESADANVLAKYRGTWTATAAVICTPYAAATVKLKDLSSESGWDMRRQGSLIIAKYAMGHRSLRPEAAVQLATA